MFYDRVKGNMSDTKTLEQEIQLLQSTKALQEEQVVIVQRQLSVLQEQRQKLEATDNHRTMSLTMQSLLRSYPLVLCCAAGCDQTANTISADNTPTKK
jgi:hypothetical protein